MVRVNLCENNKRLLRHQPSRCSSGRPSMSMTSSPVLIASSHSRWPLSALRFKKARLPRGSRQPNAWGNPEDAYCDVDAPRSSAVKPPQRAHAQVPASRFTSSTTMPVRTSAAVSPASSGRTRAALFRTGLIRTTTNPAMHNMSSPTQHHHRQYHDGPSSPGAVSFNRPQRHARHSSTYYQQYRSPSEHARDLHWLLRSNIPRRRRDAFHPSQAHQRNFFGMGEIIGVLTNVSTEHYGNVTCRSFPSLIVFR